MSSLCYVFFFFFLMIRRPPRSTLFPTRRSSDLLCCQAVRTQCLVDSQQLVVDRRRSPIRMNLKPVGKRSEEHTSELQSQSNLVCRLLLEKKKKKTLR